MVHEEKAVNAPGGTPGIAGLRSKYTRQTDPATFRTTTRGAGPWVLLESPDKEALPISYRIDREQNVVRTTASGILTDEDVLSHKRALLNDPAFTVDLCELSDVRAVTDLRVTPAGVRAMVSLDAAQAVKLHAYRLAIVTEQEAVFGMARMYQTLTERNVSHVGVFKSYHEAATWLGINALDG